MAGLQRNSGQSRWALPIPSCDIQSAALRSMLHILYACCNPDKLLPYVCTSGWGLSLVSPKM